MKAIILIAVRMKSARLPKKALLDVEGKTVLERIIERMKKTKIPASIIVCTSVNPDDAILVEVAKKNEVKWFRGSENDVLHRFISAAEQEKADIIVRVTGDNPLTDPEYIDKMLEQHIKTSPDYTYVASLPEGVTAEVMSLSALKRCREKAANPEMSEYMTHYFRDSGMFKILKMEPAPEVNRPKYRLTVDNPEDIQLIRAIYKELGSDGSFSLKEVIELLDRKPELAKSNVNAKRRNTMIRINNKKMEIVEIK